LGVQHSEVLDQFLKAFLKVNIVESNEENQIQFLFLITVLFLLSKSSGKNKLKEIMAIHSMKEKIDKEEFSYLMDRVFYFVNSYSELI
jgi:hypothetical protein